MQVDETIVPVVVVADVSESSSNIIRRASAWVTEGAVAAEFFVARLELPTGVLGMVRRIQITNGQADRSMRVFFGSSFVVVPTQTADKSYIDGRLRAAGETPAGVFVADTQLLALATTHAFINSQARNTAKSLDLRWPFGRTNAFDFIEFQNSVVNETIEMSIEWDEFPPVI